MNTSVHQFKRLLLLLVFSLSAANLFAQNSLCRSGTNSEYYYGPIGTHIALMWSSGDVNGSRCINWEGDIDSFRYEWDLSSGGSIGRITRDSNSPGFNPQRVDDCGPLNVQRTTTLTHNGTGDYSNMIYGWLGSSSTGPYTLEWYVIEEYNNKWGENADEYLGQVTTNGSVYDCYRSLTDIGHMQYLAFRVDQRSGGTTSVKAIMDFWRSKGMPNEYVMEIGVGEENFNAGGGTWEATDIVIPACDDPGTTAPEEPTPGGEDPNAPPLTADNQGWTVLDPVQVEKILYVSATGDDASAQVYTLPSEAVGEDPQLPQGPVNAFQTIEGAASNVSDGEAAWILLQRGDTFENQSLVKKQGTSEQAPFVYSYYGAEGAAPLLKTGAAGAINVCCEDFAHFWIVGLSFYAHTRNPDDPDYQGPRGNPGFRFLAQNSHRIENILVEGCTFRYYANNVVQGQGEFANVRIRRNGIFDNYSTTAHSQGLYAGNVEDLVLEENVFDHNGWYRQATDTQPGTDSKANGQGTKFNHNTYFANVSDVRFVGNAFYRPSSIGTKWTANNGPGSASGIEMTDNLYHDCELAISIGGNDTDPANPYRFRDIVLRDNVISSPGLSAPTNRVLGWGIEIDDWDQGQAVNNLIIHQNSEGVRNGQGIILKGQNREVVIEDNVLYDLVNTIGFDVREIVSLSEVAIRQNVVEADLATKQAARLSEPLASYPFTGNTYVAADPGEPSFRIGADNLNLAQWQERTGETGVSTTAPSYPDPERSVEQYVEEVLGLSDMATFYAALRQQTKLNWQVSYTAPVINAWIKEGFAATSPSAAEARVTVRARGTTGREEIQLLADETPVGEPVTLAPTMADYDWDVDPTVTTFRVAFVNNGVSEQGEDRNVQVDYLAYDGITLQAEDQPTNTGSWNEAESTCGGVASEWLFCDGYIDFGPESDAASATTADPLRSSGTELFKTYPNPTSQQLVVEGDDDYQTTLYRITGQPVMRRRHLKGIQRLDVSHLRPGVYLLEVRDAQRRQIRRRVIIE